MTRRGAVACLQASVVGYRRSAREEGLRSRLVRPVRRSAHRGVQRGVRIDERLCHVFDAVVVVRERDRVAVGRRSVYALAVAALEGEDDRRRLHRHPGELSEDAAQPVGRQVDRRAPGADAGDSA